MISILTPYKITFAKLSKDVILDFTSSHFRTFSIFGWDEAHKYVSSSTICSQFE